MRRLAAAGLTVAALAGCGSTHTKGSATLWITRDRGQHVLLVSGDHRRGQAWGHEARRRTASISFVV